MLLSVPAIVRSGLRGGLIPTKAGLLSFSRSTTRRELPASKVVVSGLACGSPCYTLYSTVISSRLVALIFRLEPALEAGLIIPRRGASKVARLKHPEGEGGFGLHSNI